MKCHFCDQQARQIKATDTLRACIKHLDKRIVAEIHFAYLVSVYGFTKISSKVFDRFIKKHRIKNIITST